MKVKLKRRRYPDGRCREDDHDRYGQRLFGIDIRRGKRHRHKTADGYVEKNKVVSENDVLQKQSGRRLSSHAVVDAFRQNAARL